MNLTLEAKYLRMETSRNRLLDELESLETELLKTAPEEGKWSIMQHLGHLVLVDKYTLGYVQRKLEQPEKLRDVQISGIFKSALLKLALLSGRKYKAPSVVATMPDYDSLVGLRQQWDDLRFTMEDVLSAIPEDLLHKALFKHPRTGYMNISQTLKFLQAHFDHHLRIVHQLKKRLIS
ncbi:DinB family protein [Pontibacter sp. CAU 1760]